MKFIDRSIRIAIILILGPLWAFSNPVNAQDAATNLVLVTLDGVRWQEVFGGVDQSLIDDERYTHNPDALKQAYWHDQRSARRERLFPFLWSVIASEGALIGDRDQGSNMEVSNNWWFSYPGYNEILTGRADPAIDSNDKNWNSNVTFLEVLNNTEGFEKRVLAFGSWDVFPYIVNTQRSSVPVNTAGDSSPPSIERSERKRWLDEVATLAPRLWSSVRLDFLTHGYALEALEEQRPRVTFIAYGETDDFAHDQNYDRHIDAAHRTDQMLAELWNAIQSNPFYRDRTTLLITTDHGRGNTADGWPHHASPAALERAGIEDSPLGVEGSDQIWIAAIGPLIRPAGLIRGQWKQSQVAATALSTLLVDPEILMPEADKAIAELLSIQTAQSQAAED